MYFLAECVYLGGTHLFPRHHQPPCQVDKNINTRSDEQIVRRLADGDLGAMETVYGDLFGQLYNYTSSYIPDGAQAEEIVQETFLYLWEHRRALRPDSNLKAYLLRIARNKSLNWLARARARHNYADYMQRRELDINYEALRDKTAELVIVQELEAIIARTLAELPEPYRVVFEMSRIEELTYAEIAERLGVSVKTVEYRMMHTLKIFRKNLQPYLPFIILFLTGLRS